MSMYSWLYELAGRHHSFLFVSNVNVKDELSLVECRDVIGRSIYMFSVANRLLLCCRYGSSVYIQIVAAVLCRHSYTTRQNVVFTLCLSTVDAIPICREGRKESGARAILEFGVCHMLITTRLPHIRLVIVLVVDTFIFSTHQCSTYHHNFCSF